MISLHEVSPLVCVSIIMPCFNGARYIALAVDSVIRQTFGDWELLIIDNNSIDDSLVRIQEFAFQDSRIILVQCSEPGAAKARNAGIKKARGRYIAFLDCDDVWLPEKLQRQIQAMLSSGAVFCWSSYRVINANGQAVRDQLASPEIKYETFMTKRSVIGCLTAIYDSEQLGKLYMPNIRMRQDYALWARIIHLVEEKKFLLLGITDVLAYYRVHDDAMTQNKIAAAFYQWCFYRDIEGLTRFSSLFYFLHYLFNAICDRFANFFKGVHRWLRKYFSL